MTKEEKISELRQEVAAMISRNEGRIEKMTLKMNEDYINFFHWSAGDMYEAIMMRKHLENARWLIFNESYEKICEGLRRMVSNLEQELISASPFGSCTNEIVNLEHRLELDAKREIRQQLLQLVWVSDYNI